MPQRPPDLLPRAAHPSTFVKPQPGARVTLEEIARRSQFAGRLFRGGSAEPGPTGIIAQPAPPAQAPGTTAVPVPFQAPGVGSSATFYFPGRRLITDAQYCSHATTALGAYPSLSLIPSGGIVWRTDRYVLGVYLNINTVATDAQWIRSGIWLIASDAATFRIGNSSASPDGATPGVLIGAFNDVFNSIGTGDAAKEKFVSVGFGITPLFIGAGQVINFYGFADKPVGANSVNVFANANFYTIQP